MSIFNNIKKALSNNAPPNRSVSNVENTNRSILESVLSSKYYTFTKSERFNKKNSTALNNENTQGLESFFSVDKKNPKLIGFEKRSRKKFRNLFDNDKVFIAYAAGEIEIIKDDIGRKLILKDTPLEKVRPVACNENGIILHSKEIVAFINISTNIAFTYEFKFQPFSFAVGDDFWLVGTRETYNGPGELYSFDFNGNVNWIINFKEKFDSVFGEITFMPYLLEVSKDSSDILIASMDRMYRLDTSGNLIARIALSELREQELKNKQKELQSSILKPPTTREEAISQYAKELASQFSMSMERMSINSPFLGFAHDIETDMLFILEEKGRVSAWGKDGKLLWINSFKNEGRYISWTDNKLIISFQSGETFWLNRDGRFIYGAKLPMQAATIQLISNQNKYLVVCEDNRLYEMHKETGELTKGAEGHPGMKLFKFANQNIFFDGGINANGYFWLAPTNHEWVHFEAKDFTETNDSNSAIAPEITGTKKFTKRWELKSNKDHFGSRIIDFKNHRIYVVEKGLRKSQDEYFKLTDIEREKDRLSHELIAYNFDGSLIWRKHIFSSMYSLFLSPDGETIFTSIPESIEITYYPGSLVMISKDGEIKEKIKVENHGFHLEFTTDSRALIHYATESGQTPVKGILNKDYFGKWSLRNIENGSEKKNDFGQGINKIKIGEYQITRTDKKKYDIESSIQKQELKLPAAIYEAFEILGNHLVLRIGTRMVAFYNQSIEKVGDVKEEENIQSVCPGDETFVVVTKTEIKGYDYTGEVVWRYSAIPKATEARIYWFKDLKLYLWIVSNNIECIVASINETGKVLKSQSFDGKEYHRAILVSGDDGWFAAQTNSEVQIYNI